VAKEIVELTEKAVFVAHNVRFDYSFLREEFKRLGYTYTRKTLCTVRLSRKAFPGLPSYSLGNLIKHFNISVADRHRAMADTLATTQILEMILQQEEGKENINELVNMGIREALLPKAIDIERIHGLPEECGVYYFHDTFGQVVYVGKSKNIKKRVATHFAKKTHKASLLQKHVADISFELTGSELVALLLESYEIKRLAPPINRAQRQKIFPYFIHYYHDPDGVFSFRR
jgi:DNA polymerase-3 subunit epsilon